MLSAEKKIKHVEECKGIENHDFDLIHELDMRLELHGRANQRIANAKGHEELQQFWRDLKTQEEKTIKKLRELLKGEIRKECF